MRTGVLFDFNGTMFFDEQFQEDSWKQFVGEKVGRDISDEEFRNCILGRNADFVLQYFLNRELTRDEIIDLEEEKEVIYRRLCLGSGAFHLAPGLPKFLDKLKARGIPITIVTASCWNNVRFFFEQMKLDKWFDIDRVVYNDGSFPGKPEPDMYLLAARKIGLPAEACIVFEDSLSGIEAAKRAGARQVIKVDPKMAASPEDGIISIRDYSSNELASMITGI